MGDRNDENFLIAIMIIRGENDRAGAVLRAFFATFEIFGTPQIGIADDQARRR